MTEGGLEKFSKYFKPNFGGDFENSEDAANRKNEFVGEIAKDSERLQHKIDADRLKAAEHVNEEEVASFVQLIKNAPTEKLKNRLLGQFESIHNKATMEEVHRQLSSEE